MCEYVVVGCVGVVRAGRGAAPGHGVVALGIVFSGCGTLELVRIRQRLRGSLLVLCCCSSCGQCTAVLPASSTVSLQNTAGAPAPPGSACIRAQPPAEIIVSAKAQCAAAHQRLCPVAIPWLVCAL